MEHSKEFLLELDSSEGLRKFNFWRSNLTFIQDSKLGLIPERYKNYRVSTQPFTHEYLPWSACDGISCLVLEKFDEN